MFEEPFDAYLGYLLQLTKDIVPTDKDLEIALTCYSPKLVSNNSSRWTLWVSMDIRSQFDQQKGLLMPNRTHGSFVEFLISYRNYLESRGELPPFFAVKKPYSKSSTSNSLPPMLSSCGTLTSHSDLLAPTQCWSYSNPDLQTPEFYKMQPHEAYKIQSPELYKMHPSPLMMTSALQSSSYQSSIPRSSTSMALFNGELYDSNQIQFEPEYYVPSDNGSFYYPSQYALYQEPDYYVANECTLSPDVVAAVSISDHYDLDMGCY